MNLFRAKFDRKKFALFLSAISLQIFLFLPVNRRTAAFMLGCECYHWIILIVTGSVLREAVCFCSTEDTNQNTFVVSSRSPYRREQNVTRLCNNIFLKGRCYNQW